MLFVVCFELVRVFAAPLRDQGAVLAAEFSANSFVAAFAVSFGLWGFRLLDRKQGISLTSGAPIIGQLNPGNSVELYQLSGEPGQRLRFDLAANSWSNANWILYDPSGAALRSPSSFSPDFTVTLPSRGTYTLAIVGSVTTPLNYNFSVSDLSVTPITNSGLNTVQNGTLTAGQTREHTFTATAGTLVLLDNLDNTAASQMRVRLLNPDGTIAFNDHQLSTDRGPILLEQSGAYKVEVFGATGPYQFTVLELPKSVRSPNTNYLEIGGVDAGILSPLQSKVYSFDGVMGQQMIFNPISGQNVRASLYDPNGNQLFTQSELAWWRNRDPITLGQSGMYSLVVENTSPQSRPYTFQFLDLKSASEIKYGIPVSRTLDNAQPSQVFKLSAEAGQQLYFDSLTPTLSSEHRWRLFDTSNKVIFDSLLNQDADVSINQTGDYFLYVQGGATANQSDYSFRVWQHGSSAEAVLTPGTGENASNSTETQGVFAVKLAVQDSLGATTTQDYKIKVWADPDNSNPVILSTPKTRFALSDQAYQYQLDIIGNKWVKRTSSAYHIRVWNRFAAILESPV